MEQEEQLNKIDDTSGETNLYRELIMNNENRATNDTNGAIVNFQQCFELYPA